MQAIRLLACSGRQVAASLASPAASQLPDPWSRRLFIALCRRYGIKPYRFARMKRQTVIVKAPRSFQETVLWSEFKEANAALSAFLSDITDKVFRDTIFRDASDVDEVEEPRAIG